MLFSPCGHTVCSGCAEAALMCTTAGDEGAAACCVCDSAIGATIRNTELAAQLTPSSGGPTSQSVTPLDVTAVAEAASCAASSDTTAAVWCARHPDQELLFVCTVTNVPMCVTCAGECGMEEHFRAITPLADEQAESSLVSVLGEFETSVARVLRTEAVAAAGVAETVAAGEYAIEQTKAKFEALRKLLDTSEARLLQASGAETRRRAKVLEAQATELGVTAAQAQAVVRVGRTALESADPLAIARAHKLAFTSRGLLDPHLALKVSPALTLQMDVAGIQRVLEVAHVGAIDDPAHDCALASHTLGQRQVHDTRAEWALLLETCSPHLPHPVASAAFCRAVSTLLTKLHTDPLSDGCQCCCGQVYDALIRAMPPRGSLDSVWCEAWCEAATHVGEVMTCVDHALDDCMVATLGARVLAVLEQVASGCGFELSWRAWRAAAFLNNHYGLGKAQVVRLSIAAFATFADSPDALSNVLLGAAMLGVGDIDLSSAVFGAMVRHLGHEQFQVHGLQFFNANGSGASVVTTLRTLGVFDHIAAVLAKHPRSNNARVSALRLLTKVVRVGGGTSCQATFDIDKIEAAITHPASLGATLRAATAIACLRPLPAFAETPGGVIHMLHRAAKTLHADLLSPLPSVVVGALNGIPLFWGTLTTVSGLVYDNHGLEMETSISSSLWKDLVWAGGCVLEVLAAHPCSEAVQFAGIITLRNLCSLQEPGYACIFAAMDAFPDCAAIQRAALFACHGNANAFDRAHALVLRHALLPAPLLQTATGLFWNMDSTNLQQYAQFMVLLLAAAEKYPSRHVLQSRLMNVMVFVFVFTYPCPTLVALMAKAAVGIARTHPSPEILANFATLQSHPTPGDAIRAALLANPL